VTGTLLTHGQINTLIFYIAFLLAFIAVTVLAHFFKAWVALKLGDQTPAEHGFLSFNPVDHIDPIGLACFLFFGLGWGAYVPINSLNIHGYYRGFKIVLAYLSDVFAYISIGIVCMILLALTFDSMVIPASATLVAYGGLSYQALHGLYPEQNSLVIAFGFILLCAMYLCAMLGALQFIIDLFHLFLHTYAVQHLSSIGEFVLFIAPLVTMLLLTGPLRLFITYNITVISIFITRLLGLS
jgi:hypothetical protein